LLDGFSFLIRRFDSFEGIESVICIMNALSFGKQSEMEGGKCGIRPLPAVRFDGARYKEAKVNRYFPWCSLRLTVTLFPQFMWERKSP
jgi:hypothetical protein